MSTRALLGLLSPPGRPIAIVKKILARDFGEEEPKETFSASHKQVLEDVLGLFWSNDGLGSTLEILST